MIRPRLSISAATLALALAVAAAACKRHDGAGQAPGSAAPATAGAGSAAPAGPAAPAATADHVRILGHHNPPKPTDPVVIEIPKFRVVKASFDPAKIEGGTADLELDLSSLDSGSAKRDKHLESPDMLDVAKFATAEIHVDHVVKTGADSYAADATVNVHGLTRKLPVTFDVLERTPNGIRIKGKATFDRFDFAIGTRDDGVPIADQQDVEIQVTLTST